MVVEVGKTYKAYQCRGKDLDISDGSYPPYDTGKDPEYRRSVLIRKSVNDQYICPRWDIDKFSDDHQITVDSIDDTFFYVTAPGIIFGGDSSTPRIPDHFYQIPQEDGEYYFIPGVVANFRTDPIHGFSTFDQDCAIRLPNGRIVPYNMSRITKTADKVTVMVRAGRVLITDGLALKPAEVDEGAIRKLQSNLYKKHGDNVENVVNQVISALSMCEGKIDQSNIDKVLTGYFKDNTTVHSDKSLPELRNMLTIFFGEDFARLWEVNMPVINEIRYCDILPAYIPYDAENKDIAAKLLLEENDKTGAPFDSVLYLRFKAGKLFSLMPVASIQNCVDKDDCDRLHAMTAYAAMSRPY